MKTMAQALDDCANNLRRIHAALVRYRAEHDDQMPDWLSDLVPDYLTSETLLCPAETLLCPADEERGSRYYRDPHTSCSYDYEFNGRPIALKYREIYGKTSREWQEKKLKEFGDIVPTVRCNHRRGDLFLNLTYGGKFFFSEPGWERNPREDYPTSGAAAISGEKQK